MSPRRHRVGITLGLFGLLACSDIAEPLRDDIYEWRIFAPSTTGGTDTLSFHWDPALLPVRVWVEDVADLPQHMSRAIDIWQSAFLYREFRAVLVSDSLDADVIVLGSAAPKFRAASMRLHGTVAPECSGATDVVTSPDNRQLLLPIRIFLDFGFDPSVPGVADCLALTGIHELGHALGIFEHSPNSTDIMFLDPVVALPSPRDRQTAEVVYHVPSTVAPVRP